MACPSAIARSQRSRSHVQGCLNGCLARIGEVIISWVPPAVIEGVKRGK